MEKFNYIEIVNSDNLSIIDGYNIYLNDTNFNINKFKELIKFNGISLDKDFMYKNIYYGEIVEKTPLFYPCSTLLLANAIGEEKAREIILETTNDNMLADYITQMVATYNPLDFHSVYKLVKNDSRLNYVPNGQALEDILREKDMDLVNFVQIFRHIDFEYKGSVYAGVIRQYLENLRSNTSGGVLPKYLGPDYIRYNVANENRKVLKLLNLTPNRIN